MAQEDHARRAVLAAFELRQRLHDAPALRTQLVGGCPHPCMGLHSGLVVVGESEAEPSAARQRRSAHPCTSPRGSSSRPPLGPSC